MAYKTTVFKRNVTIGRVVDYIQICNNLAFNKRVFVVTDQNVFDSSARTEFAKKISVKVHWIVLKPGEAYKNIQSVSAVLMHLDQNNFTANDVLIGFGGGVVCDLTSFIASTLYRGVAHVLVPTSVIAMVDAAIGGKTGINYLNIKNYLGTVYPAYETIIDPTYLESLPALEYKQGVAEVLKIALIADKTLLKKLIKNNFTLNEEIIKRSILAKKAIVEKDAYSLNRRKMLNFGHTLGHTIESSLNLDIAHGEAVLYGMLLETELIYEKSLIRKPVFDKVLKAIKSFPLYKREKLEEIRRSILVKYLFNDKKQTKNSEITLTKVKKIGKGELVNISISDIQAYLN